MSGGAGRGAVPRPHWLLLAAVLLALVAALVVAGVVQHATGGSGTVAAGGGSAALPSGTGPLVVPASTPDRSTSASARPGYVALTFDDGPDPEWTPQVLRILREHGVHATFFVVGSHAGQYPQLVAQIVAEGHEIGVHTFTHVDLASVDARRLDAELSYTQSVVAAASGVQTRLMRPPYSSTTDAVTAAQWPAYAEIGAQGYAAVLSTEDTKDWSDPGVARIVAGGVPARGTGGIVLMHDGGGDRAQTVAALPALIERLQADGFTLGTVSQVTGTSAAQSEATSAQVWTGRALIGVTWVSDHVVSALAVLLLVFLVLGLLRALLLVVLASRHARSRRGQHELVGPLPSVSVVVPAYNEAAGIGGTLRSLVATGYPDLEIIVVDDGSDDGTAEAASALLLPGVRVVRQTNGGKPSALNTGIALARGEILVLVDADTVFASDAIHALARAFDDPEVGAVSGNTKVANRERLLGRWQHLEYVVGFNLDRRAFAVMDCITTVPGAIGAFRRTALAEVGGVPADTLAEDTDLTMAVARAGWRVEYEQAAVAWTEVPSTMRQLWKQRYRWCYGTLQSMWKHRHAVVEHGRAGHLGRRGLPYLLVFQVLMPLLGPVVDVMALYGLFFLDWRWVLGVAAVFVAVQLALGAYALHLDHEPMRPLWALPLQQLVYRQVMYLVVVQSVAAALEGARVGWQPLDRHGAAATLVDTSATP
ncbi:MAG: bifunctional polysaccharide deacetylase/glycosyltransferase family 2 protein [Candidatus Nanopelagicales bacterium]